ncbi:MAG: response regulator [Kofleriaceae bacterium]|nr:response regulator [Kofleriaceae bacterium]
MGYPYSRSARILVVDGEPAALRAVTRMLPEDQVEGATRIDVGRQRVIEAEQEGYPFSIVLCDIELDEGRGVELLRTCREQREVPLFVFMSRIELVTEAGWLSDDVLVKPFSADEVMSTIARLLLRRSNARTRRRAAITLN